MEIHPYVTDKGGVVILNGPFKIKEAHKIARLCEISPLLLEWCQWAVEYIELMHGPKQRVEEMRNILNAKERECSTVTSPE